VFPYLTCDRQIRHPSQEFFIIRPQKSCCGERNICLKIQPSQQRDLLCNIFFSRGPFFRHDGHLRTIYFRLGPETFFLESGFFCLVISFCLGSLFLNEVTVILIVTQRIYRLVIRPFLPILLVVL